jgi:Domain of unknown function (DUF4158)
MCGRHPRWARPPGRRRTCDRRGSRWCRRRRPRRPAHDRRPGGEGDGAPHAVLRLRHASSSPTHGQRTVDEHTGAELHPSLLTRRRREHVAWVIERAGWTRCGRGERNRLGDWLVARALEHDTLGAVPPGVGASLRAERIVRPSLDRLIRAVAWDRVEADQEIHHRPAPGLTPPAGDQLDAPVTTDPARGVPRRLGGGRRAIAADERSGGREEQHHDGGQRQDDTDCQQDGGRDARSLSEGVPAAQHGTNVARRWAGWKEAFTSAASNGSLVSTSR